MWLVLLSFPAVTPTASKSINLELLQRKVKQLEDENKSLRTETAQLVKETDECEEQERRLMADIANQLTTANSEFDGLSKYGLYCSYLLCVNVNCV